MPALSQDYQQLVLDDLKTYVGLNHPVKASLWERLTTTMVPIGQIHPNPDDEFSDPEIGPNMSIVSQYVEEWSGDSLNGETPRMHPLSVEKMSVGGYMLLDGHHRWLAAHRLGIRKLPVHLMNVTPVDELLSAIAASDRRMYASFDLDEVLLTAQPKEAEKRAPMAFHHYMKKSMRKNSPALIRELQELGFDVWVYTSGYLPEDTLKKLFRYHGVTVDGIVNGLRNTQTRAAMRKAFNENYDVSVHIDNQGIVCVETATKQYDTVDISAGETDWSAKAFAAVKADPIITAHLKQK